MESERGVAAVNGTGLWYEVAGSGPALVLIHGFTLDTRMWDDQFAAFAEHYRVVRYDARGFGKSDTPDGEPYAHSDDLAALLAHLSIPQAIIIGLSMGGRIAIDFALAYPAMTRALIPVDAAVGGYHWSDSWNETFGHIRITARAEGIEAAKREWLNHALFAPANEQADVAERLQRMVGDYSGWAWTHRDPERPLEPPAITRLSEVAAPTLVLLGERDLADFHAIADTVAQQVPAARKVVIPGAGHMANMEAPTRFNAEVLAFLATL